MSALSRVYGRRRLFTTRKKYLGLGPASLEVGDSVFILPEPVVPFILRPTQAPCLKPAASIPRSFNLVGEAYIHGIMHGEAFPEGSDRDAQFQEIELL